MYNIFYDLYIKSDRTVLYGGSVYNIHKICNVQNVDFYKRNNFQI